MTNASYYVSDNRPWFKHYPEGVPHHLDYPEVPLYQFLDDSAEKYPNKTALVFYGKEITYKNLKELSDRFANALQNLGIQKGDRVAFLLPNCPQFVIGFWGTLKIGACVVSMNPLYAKRELTELLTDSGAKTIIVLDALYPKLKKIQKETKIEKVIIASIADYFPVFLKVIFILKNLPRRITQKDYQIENIYQFKKIIEKNPLNYKKVKINSKKDLAVLQYTGGTTGRPKGIMLTHRNLVVNTIQLKYWFPLQKGEETIIGLVPFFHIGGITSSLTWGSCGVAKVIILPRFHTKPTLKAITKYKATVFFGVPAIYIALDKTIDENKRKYSLNSLKLTGGGMAPFPRALFDIYRKKYGKRLIEGYGLTETAGVTFQNVNNQAKEYKLGSIGFPFPDTEVKIIDIKTKEMLGQMKLERFA